jgi:hypothetical protein
VVELRNTGCRRLLRSDHPQTYWKDFAQIGHYALRTTIIEKNDAYPAQVNSAVG